MSLTASNNTANVKTPIMKNDKFRFLDLDQVELDYIDQNDYKNSLQITKKDNRFILKGSSFNFDSFNPVGSNRSVSR